MWVLIEELATKRTGHPIYYWAPTAIGPSTTPDLNAAWKFESKQDAMMSPAYVHPFSCFEPQNLTEQGAVIEGDTPNEQ